MHSVEPGTTTRSPGALLWRRAYRTVLLVVLLAGVLFSGGFYWFVSQMPVVEASPSHKADGIVVLTGGAFRISDALELLSTGHGRRLLISGVNRNTRSYEIARLVPEHQRWFSCCVDLDYSATNTIGNAVETRRWVVDRGFKSVIVVTANYHMPRAMAELGHELPEVSLVPYAVVSDRVKVDDWWDNPDTARLLFLEYLKYIVARVRMTIPPSLA
ncbi:YdcF family protein [Rhodoplanes sp. Z2-YC6860]|uniref:YdcF family protein n=1 Tax=Rhodoplanes sp. Z2-YC6860 TaxID=674703 RepID=UPI00078C8752|nr:YdcF family protein [Rhodoplanes sp. Z2-YC6860]AMN39668.1 hypothetical protein RHPLAN_12070 [Rhodoplanes sp. Z2-YC6860]